MSEIGTGEATQLLQVSAPTVRAWAGDGKIAGRQVLRGGRQVWRLDGESVEHLARERAERARSQLTLASLAARADTLEQQVPAPTASVATASGRGGAGSAVGDVDVLALRAVVAEQAAADAARAKVIEHLLAALAASEDADKHRRAAIDAAQTALGYRLIPDDPSSVEDTRQR